MLSQMQQQQHHQLYVSNALAARKQLWAAYCRSMAAAMDGVPRAEEASPLAAKTPLIHESLQSPNESAESTAGNEADGLEDLKSEGSSIESAQNNVDDDRDAIDGKNLCKHGAQ